MTSPKPLQSLPAKIGCLAAIYVAAHIITRAVYSITSHIPMLWYSVTFYYIMEALRAGAYRLVVFGGIILFIHGRRPRCKQWILLACTMIVATGLWPVFFHKIAFWAFETWELPALSMGYSAIAAFLLSIILPPLACWAAYSEPGRPVTAIANCFLRREILIALLVFAAAEVVMFGLALYGATQQITSGTTVIVSTPAPFAWLSGILGFLMPVYLFDCLFRLTEPSAPDDAPGSPAPFES